MSVHLWRGGETACGLSLRFHTLDMTTSIAWVTCAGCMKRSGALADLDAARHAAGGSAANLGNGERQTSPDAVQFVTPEGAPS